MHVDIRNCLARKGVTHDSFIEIQLHTSLRELLLHDLRFLKPLMVVRLQSACDVTLNYYLLSNSH